MRHRRAIPAGRRIAVGEGIPGFALESFDVFGAWRDRADIGDSTEYVRELRRTHWGPK